MRIGRIAAEIGEQDRHIGHLATKLLAGRTIVHVYAEASPGPQFEPVEPDLKDVYFSVMTGHHGRRAVAAGAAA